MAILNPYLIFNGNCEEAFLFYADVFQVPFPKVMRFGDMSKDAEPKLSKNDANRIMHITLPLANGTTLMGSDSNSVAGEVTFGENISISINTESEKEANTLFEGLSNRGIIKMPIQKTFWNAYFGMLTDKFGINWMINFDY
jgi:PhnB protein